MSRRADIVAIQGQILWVIETKLSLSLELLEQARTWQRYAHWVSICYPRRQSLGHYRYRFEVKDIVIEMLEHFGIGMLHAEEQYVHDGLRPRMNRRAHTDYITDVLTEEHKTFAKAGNNKGLFWSPFQSTCQHIAAYVEKNPGVTLTNLLQNVRTHYASPASARACIVTWARSGKIDGVELREEQRELRLYPCERKKPKVVS